MGLCLAVADEQARSAQVRLMSYALSTSPEDWTPACYGYALFNPQAERRARAALRCHSV